MNINDLINQFVLIKGQKEDLAASIKTCNEELARIEADIMAKMAEAGINQAASDKATCSMKQVTHPAITDWDAFYNHVTTTGQFELLQKRLSSTAFKERWAAGDTVPGTSTTTLWELSVRRK